MVISIGKTSILSSFYLISLTFLLFIPKPQENHSYLDFEGFLVKGLEESGTEASIQDDFSIAICCWQSMSE